MVLTFETTISKRDDNSFLKFLVRLYHSLHLRVCVCVYIFHWFAELCAADVYVDVKKKKKISARIISLRSYLPV